MTEYKLPSLKRHEGSYVICRRDTGEGVIELFRGSKLLKKVNYDKYEAIPIGDYLSGINEKIKQQAKV